MTSPRTSRSANSCQGGSGPEGPPVVWSIFLSPHAKLVLTLQYPTWGEREKDHTARSSRPERYAALSSSTLHQPGEKLDFLTNLHKGPQRAGARSARPPSHRLSAARNPFRWSAGRDCSSRRRAEAHGPRPRYSDDDRENRP